MIWLSLILCFVQKACLIQKPSFIDGSQLLNLQIILFNLFNIKLWLTRDLFRLPPCLRSKLRRFINILKVHVSIFLTLVRCNIWMMFVPRQIRGLWVVMRIIKQLLLIVLLFLLIWAKNLRLKFHKIWCYLFFHTLPGPRRFLWLMKWFILRVFGHWFSELCSPKFRSTWQHAGNSLAP